MLTSFGGGRKFPSRRGPKISPELALWLRFIGLRIIIAVLFGTLVVQLWRLQIVEGRKYQVRAEYNRLRDRAIPPLRGVIYDRNGAPLVRNVPSFTVSVVPDDLPVSEQAKVAERLAKLLKMRPEEVEKPIAQRRLKGDLFQAVPIKTAVDREAAMIIDEQHLYLKGVQVQVDSVRQYLGGLIFAHMLGYTGRIDDDEYKDLESQGYSLNERVGKTGLEYSYEKTLRGVPGREQMYVDASGRPVGDVLEMLSPVPGSNLVLTIDSNLQTKVAEAVRETMGESKYAVGIVLNPKTGELLSFVSLPGYDNNLFSGTVSDQDWDSLLKSPSRPLVNHGISENFPPGSIFKLITAGASLQEGIAGTETSIFSKGYLEVPADYDPRVKFVFRDWAAHGWLNFYEAIAKSGDVYFYELGGGFEDFVGLGVDRLAAYARAFGLGERTGIDLPGEVEGIVPTPAWKLKERKEEWYKGDTYNMSIGQGFVTVTPLQMIMLIGSFANGGELLMPRLVREVLDANRNVIQRSEKVVRRIVPVSKNNMAEVIKGMVLGVEWSGGTARDAGLPGLKVAAKTGTAEFGQRDPVTGRYEFQHGWAYAMAPVEDPEICVLVFHERGGGPATAAPAVGKILKYYFAGRLFQPTNALTIADR